VKRLVEKRAARRTRDRRRAMRSRMIDRGKARCGRVTIAGRPWFAIGADMVLAYPGVVLPCEEWTGVLAWPGGKRSRPLLLSYPSKRMAVVDGAEIGLHLDGCVGLHIRNAVMRRVQP